MKLQVASQTHLLLMFKTISNKERDTSIIDKTLVRDYSETSRVRQWLMLSLANL